MLFYIFISTFVFLVNSIKDGNRELKYIGLFFVLWLAAGTSSNFSIDYPAYREMYENEGFDVDFGIEPIWKYWAGLLTFLGFASRGWFLFTSLVIISLFFYGIRRMSVDITFSVVLFVICYFYFESLNGIRQYVAIGIIFAAFHYLLDNKLWFYLIIIIIAAQFHKSAYFLIPIVFFLRIHWPQYLFWILLGVSFLLGPLLMERGMALFLSYMGGGKYHVYTENVIQSGVNTGILKIFYNLLAILILYSSTRIKKLDPRYYIYINTVIFSIILYNIFYTFQPALRLSWYLFPFFIILFPILLKVYSYKSQLLLKSVVLIAFVISVLNMLYQNTLEGYNVDYGFDLYLF